MNKRLARKPPMNESVRLRMRVLLALDPDVCAARLEPARAQTAAAALLPRSVKIDHDGIMNVGQRERVALVRLLPWLLPYQWLKSNATGKPESLPVPPSRAKRLLTLFRY